MRTLGQRWCKHAGMADSGAAAPKLRQVVLDCEDARKLAEFYRQMLGFSYRPGDEPPDDGTPDTQGQDWLVLRNGDGVGLAFQQVRVCRSRPGQRSATADAAPRHQRADIRRPAGQHQRALGLEHARFSIDPMIRSSHSSCTPIWQVIRFASSWLPTDRRRRWQQSGG